MGTRHKNSFKKMKEAYNEVQNLNLPWYLHQTIDVLLLRTMPILDDDDVVRICPSDLIEWDNIGTIGVRLGQKFLVEPVPD